MDLAKGTPGGCLFARAMSQTRVLAPAPDECRDSEAKPSARAMSQTGRLHIHVANAATAKEEHV